MFFSALIVVYGLVGRVVDEVSAREDIYRDLSAFTEVVNRVREDYVEEPDLERAMRGALLGMMEALDPYSSFVDRDSYQQLVSSSGVSGSLGIVLSRRYGYPYIVSVVSGSPADREGFRTGDLLESIDGKATMGMSLWEAERWLSGPVGSSVELRVIRARRAQPSEVKLFREQLLPQEVTARIIEDGIGLLRIPHLGEGTAEAALTKLEMLRLAGARGLMIDVRGTAVGILAEAVKICDLFLSKGKEMVRVSKRDGEEEIFLSEKEPSLVNVPLVLLVNGGTSGSAEVLAAALQDHGMGKVVGQKTNGNGSVQARFPLEDGSVLFISDRIYYRSTGEPIQARELKRSGITPDVRSPHGDFVTNFYYENSSEDLESGPSEEFYRKLNQAIDNEQLRIGLEHLHDLILEKVA